MEHDAPVDGARGARGVRQLFSLFTHNEGDGRRKITSSRSAASANSTGYHQPSSNYSLPQCPNKDTSLHCEIADPCVTTMEEKKIEVAPRRQ